jgi:MoaA/NifB/PqqE/SkfB family radical SAM enzyme
MIDSQDQIKHVHLELSSLCNARCPQCPRNFYGFPYNLGYVETNLSFEKLKSILPEKVIKQLNEVNINGNYGDFVMNPESYEIIAWLRNLNSDMKIWVSTNGGARNNEFWQNLAKLDLIILFCIDGIGDTHKIYRQDTEYEIVMKNARTYIATGGRAIWHMTEFEHNLHEFEQAHKLSQEYGFADFYRRETPRDTGPVYDRHGNKVFVMKNAKWHGNSDKIDKAYVDKFLRIKSKENNHLNKMIQVSCETKNLKSIYISSEGHITPCCYTALYKTVPEFYSGIETLLTEKTLDSALESFNEIEKTFDTNTLRVCGTICGAIAND